MTDYEEQRDLLIPEAEKFANKEAGRRPGGVQPELKEAWNHRWNRAFLTKMDELARKAGLC
jgi:hypothetical protein